MLLGLTAIRLAAAAAVPLAPDEAYYWLWSRHLQPGYYDDAPLIAVWIRAGTALLGASPLGIRLLSPLGAALGSVLLWRAGEDLFPGRNAGVLAAALLNFTVVLGAGAVITTPDTPLILFWTATIAASARALATGDDRWWLAAGFTAGLGLDSKYTALLLIVATGLWLLLARDGRRALTRSGPWLGLLLAGVVFLPVVLWNATHRWASFAKQGGRMLHWNLPSAAHHLAGLIFGQIGLVTPLIALLMAAGIARAVIAGDARSLLPLLSVLVPGAIFVEHSLSGRVEANWPAILYPGAALCAAGCATGMTRRWLLPSVAFGGALTGLVYIQAVAAPFPLPPRADPTAFQLAGWPGLARATARLAKADDARFIASSDYTIAAELAHALRGRETILGFGPRWRYFRLPAATAFASRPGLLVVPLDRGAPDPRAFRTATRVATLTRRRGGAIVKRYAVYRVIPLPGATGAVLDRSA